MELITGYYGYEHILSEDDGAFNAAVFGDGQAVLSSGNQFAASIIDNNTVRIADGDGLMFGRHFRIKPTSYEDATITTGTAGLNRIDLICATYKKNEDDGTEACYLEVIKGAEASTPTAPTYTTGNILEGAAFNQMPLYQVNISDITITSVEPLFEALPSISDFLLGVVQAFESVNENISDIQEEMKDKGAAVKLWENASPTSEFANQFISLDLTGYGFVYVICNTSTSVPSEFHYGLYPANQSMMFQMTNISYAFTDEKNRTIQPYPNGVQIYDAKYVSDGTEYTDNTQLIPVAIVGLKFA